MSRDCIKWLSTYTFAGLNKKHQSVLNDLAFFQRQHLLLFTHDFPHSSTLPFYKKTKGFLNPLLF